MDNKTEKLKLLYEESNKQFRFFLTWRQLLLAGYFAIIGALALGFKWTLENCFVPTFICPLAGAGVSVLFWALDYRNRQLYRLVSKAGADLEEKLGFKSLGPYGAYEKSKTKLPHSLILKIFYLGCGGIMFVFGVFDVLRFFKIL